MSNTNASPAIKELRIRVSVQAHSCLTALSKVGGNDISAEAREIIEKWAEAELTRYRLIHLALRDEGLPGIDVERRAKPRIH